MFDAMTAIITCVACPPWRGEPDRATIGQVCRGCRDDLDNRLADLATLHRFLPDLLTPGAGEFDDTPRGRTVPPMSARADTLNLLGPANAAHITLSPTAFDDWLCQGGPISPVEILRDIVDDVREQLALPPDAPGAQVTGMVTFLRRQLDRICAVHDPLDQLVTELRDMHNVLRDICGEHRPKPIGTCPEIVDHATGKLCGTTLWVSTYSDAVECSDCGRVWERREWRWMGRTMGVIAS